MNIVTCYAYFSIESKISFTYQVGSDKYTYWLNRATPKSLALEAINDAQLFFNITPANVDNTYSLFKEKLAPNIYDQSSLQIDDFANVIKAQSESLYFRASNNPLVDIKTNTVKLKGVLTKVLGDETKTKEVEITAQYRIQNGLIQLIRWEIPKYRMIQFKQMRFKLLSATVVSVLSLAIYADSPAPTSKI